MEENQIQARLRHVAGIILIAVLLLLAVGIGVAAFLVNSMVEVTNSQMRAETEEYKSRLNKQISSDFQILTTMSSFLEFSDVEQADNFAQILDESSLRNDFVTMAYFPVDNTGIVAILGDPVRTSVQVTDMQPEVQDVVYRTWNGETVLSYLFESELTREKIFVYGIPVEKNGQVVGSLIASDQLEIFSDILSGDTVLGGNGHIHMINTEGRFLIRSQNAIVQEDIETIFEGPYFSDEEAERVQAALAAQETIYTSFRYKGHSYQALLQPVGINNWYMLCVNSMQESSGIYRIVMVIAVTFVGALLLMVILLAYGYRLTRHSNQELHAMAFQDPLTGGDNLRSFMLRLTETMPQSGDKPEKVVYGPGIMVLHLKDGNDRPLFLSSMQQAGNYSLDGSAIQFPRNGAFDKASALMISGDFSQLVYSIRQDITFKLFTEGVVQNTDGTIAYNLMQNDMVALRAVMRLGWEIPNPVNAMAKDKAKRFPFAVLTPSAG